MEMMEDVHDGFQGVGRKGESKFDSGIGGGDLDGAGSTQLVSQCIV